MEVLIISITGILVVFTFLLFLYVIMLGFKKIFHKESQKLSSSENLSNKNFESGIPEKIIVIILTALKRYKNKDLIDKKITIKKRRL